MGRIRGDMNREEEHEVRLYHVWRRDVRRQLIPPILFFAAILVIILFSVVRHNRALDAGQADMTSNAIIADYLTSAIGAPVNENTDPVDQSYGDYFYIGADFYEVGKNTEMVLFEHKGVIVYEGQDIVTGMLWRSDETDITPEEVRSMADELATAYGPYEADGSGAYIWQRTADAALGANEDLNRVVLECEADGMVTLTAEGAEKK